MKYRYEDLSPGQFEDLVSAICRNLFGSGVQSFSDGADGGRDAKFIGVAERFPSTAGPWIGTTVIQAKHTNGYNKKFSDKAFFSADNDNCVIAKEVPRINRMRSEGKLDNYFLAANRGLPALANEKILDILSANTGLPAENTFLCGHEQLERWLKEYPTISDSVNLEAVDSPLIVGPDALAEVIAGISEALGDLALSQDKPPVPRTNYEEKNRINGMDVAYAQELRRRFLRYTRDIETFLSEPENRYVLERYSAAVEEFQFKILSRRSDFGSFEQMIEYLIDLLVNRDVDLGRNKTLTRAVVFYMYWNCDIGLDKDSNVESH